jgi:predicted Fe-S protein YdhL (DUF1289 family)
MLRRTPCVGICSTTYGDLICRGCKRFAHEIVQWNGFDDVQRQAVWTRLLTIRRGVVRDHVALADVALLRERAGGLGIRNAESEDALDLAYEVLRRIQRHGSELASLGLAPTNVTTTVPTTVAATVAREPLAGEARRVLEHIEREFYQRSIAHYEHSFRTLAQ